MAPIGMQNLFVINSALSQSKLRIFLTVSIIIFFDITLSMSAFFGMGSLITKFPILRLLILIIGGLLIIYMGYQTIRTEPTVVHVDTNVPIRKIIGSAFLVTWANPQALIDTTMMLGAFRASLPDAGIISFIAGTMVAAPIWFGGLAFTIATLSNKISISSLVWINRICGSVILLYGIKLVIEGIFN